MEKTCFTCKHELVDANAYPCNKCLSYTIWEPKQNTSDTVVDDENEDKDIEKAAEEYRKSFDKLQVLRYNSFMAGVNWYKQYLKNKQHE